MKKQTFFLHKLGALMCITTPGQSGLGSNNNEGVLPRTGASPSDIV